MKSKMIIILITIIIILGIVTGSYLLKDKGNAKNNGNSEESIENQGEEKEKELTFPYTDNQGRVRYKLVINGSEVKTENYPFKLNEEEKGSYYPLKEVLNYFNIESLSSDDNKTLTTKINGNIIRVDAEQGKMKYGKTTLEALDGNVKTILVNNILYVPSFFFMRLTDNSIVDYSVDGMSATLTTDLVVDSGSSGVTGLSLNESTIGTTNNGYHLCHKCGGAGGYNEEYFDQFLVNGRYTQVKKYRWTHCSICGGTGHIYE